MHVLGFLEDFVDLRRRKSDQPFFLNLKREGEYLVHAFSSQGADEYQRDIIHEVQFFADLRGKVIDRVGVFSIRSHLLTTTMALFQASLI